MAHSKLYRSFIILQEDERGHSTSNDKPLSGYAKVESKGDKCKIAFYAQNLKADYGHCQMVLVCNKKDGKYNVNLGPVNISPQGKAEMNVEYDANNIGDFGVSYDKIVGASLCKEISGKMVFLMCGFLNGEQPKDNWKNYKMMAAKKDDKKSVNTNKEANKQSQANTEAKKQEHKENNKGTMANSNQAGIENNMANNNQENMSNKNNINQENISNNNNNNNNNNENMTNNSWANNNNNNDNWNNNYEHHHEHKKHHDDDHHEHHEHHSCCQGRDDYESKFDDYEREIDETNRYDEDDFELRGAMGEFFGSVVDELELTRGFTKEIKNCKWYKVKVDDFDDMCNSSHYNKYTVAYYPMINYYPYIVKHGHFMLGLKCDNSGVVKYVVYGVPGTKDKKDQPYGGKTGFVTWCPDNKDGNKGHWLMFYDFQNSMVVVPMK